MHCFDQQALDRRKIWIYQRASLRSQCGTIKQSKGMRLQEKNMTTRNTIQESGHSLPRVAPPRGGSGGIHSPERRCLLALLPHLAAAGATAGSPSGCKEGGGGAPPPLLSLVPSPSPSLGGWPVQGGGGFSRRPAAGSASCLAGSEPSIVGSAPPVPLCGRAQSGHGGGAVRGLGVATAAPAAGSWWGAAAAAPATYTAASAAWAAGGARLQWP
jgi:hypothetical protein